MKKIILAIVAIFIFGTASAQEPKFGLKGGLNLATLNGDVEDAKSLLGVHFGAFVEFKISDKFSFQPELLYSMQGAKSEYSEDFEGDFYSEKLTLNLGYLNIPLMAKYFASEKFYVEAGPQIGFLLSAKADGSYTESFGGETFTETVNGENVKEDFQSLDFGLNFGLGYEFTGNLFLGARYNLGLSNVFKDSDEFKATNGVFQISVGYKF
jgi:opacity protein-like surface antigen